MRHSLFVRQKTFFAPKHAQEKKNSFWDQKNQQAKKNETHPVKPTHTFLRQPTNPHNQICEKKNHMVLSHKKLKMITTCLMHNAGHVRVYAIKKNGRHMGQVFIFNKINCPVNQATKEMKQSISVQAEGLQQPKTHPKLYIQELYIPTVNSG